MNGCPGPGIVVAGGIIVGGVHKAGLQRSGGNSPSSLDVACNSLEAPSHDQVVSLELQRLWALRI